MDNKQGKYMMINCEIEQMREEFKKMKGGMFAEEHRQFQSFISYN